MAKTNEMENHAINLIGTGTTIEGNISSSGDIRIDGNLKGNLRTKGKVILGDTGKVNGEVYCKNFEIEGSLEGKIFVTELLSLRAKSKVFGDIATSKLAIEPGAYFTGKCDMSGVTHNTNAEKATESKEK
jgi:cytoskeletal protein CcmA (bactofilin family)